MSAATLWLAAVLMCRERRSASLIVDLSSALHDVDIHSRRAGGLWKTASVLLKPKVSPPVRISLR